MVSIALTRIELTDARTHARRTNCHDISPSGLWPVELKIDLIKLSEGKSQRQLAEQFGIGKTQVQTILKCKAEWLEGYYDQTASNERKRLCKRSTNEELNVLVWEWFQRAKTNKH